jgi:large subunit ribosomal protein L1
VRRVLHSLQIQQRAHSSLFSSTSYSYSSAAEAAAAAQTEEEEEEKKNKKKSDVFFVAARLPTPIFDHHRRNAEEEGVAIKNEDGTTKPIHDVLSAVRWAKEDAKTKKFDQTVEMSIRLGVNPKRSDMIVRGTCNLPNGTGKKFYVLTFAENEEDRKMAREAGADAVGGEELIEQIKSGKFEDLNKVNVCIATPGIVAKLKSSGLARTLGPKGLMPNPKVGTLTAEVGKAVRDAKSGGRVEYRAEKNAIVHAGIGKTSFEDVAIVENATCLMASVLQNRPKGKGAPAMSNYIKKVYLSTTMGKGSRRIDAKELIKLAEEFTQRSK